MKTDPIVEEIRRIRREYVAEFNHDLEAIYKDLKRHERESGLKFVRHAPRRLPAAMVNEQGAARGV